MDVVQHHVDAMSTIKFDRVCVDLFHEQVYGTSGLHRSSADVFWGKSNLGTHDGDGGTEFCHDIGALYGGPPFIIVDCGCMSFSRGTVLL